MNKLTFPPSPNWYLSSIFTCANDGTVAWGSKNHIVITKPTDKTQILDFSIITNAHVLKVNSLVFSPEYGESNKKLLLSGGEDHTLKIWDLNTMTVFLSLDSYKDEKKKVIDVDWSKNNPNLICCVSADGFITSWNIEHVISQTISLGKTQATCIACCPHRSNLVCVGTKSGLVYVVNLNGSENIIYKLRGHDSEIVSLSWCPTDKNVLNTSDNKDLLVASSAKDKSIFIWRAGTDGRYEIRLTLPNLPLDSHHHKSKLGSGGLFTTISWIRSKLLLANSSYGELISIDLSVNNPQWKLIHGNHVRGLFSIASVSKNDSTSDQDWRSDDTLTIWTTAQDRQVICSTIKKGECIIDYNIHTHAGYIYCIAACPLDTSRIAYGTGDALIRVINLSEPHKNSCDMIIFWQKIMGRVTAVAWHPVQENILAFGTGEGRVGIVDTNNVNKPPIIFRQHHRHTVYSLGWYIHPPSENYALYSCGDHEIIYYQYEKPNASPMILIKKDCTEFSWKPDSSCMAIGYEHGEISFVDNKLKKCGQSIFHLKHAVQCLAWHPDSTAADMEYSPMKHYLAAATKASTIVVFDMGVMIDLLDDKSLEKNDAVETTHQLNTVNNIVQYKIVASLTGHADTVACLAWNPHLSGYLVSGSFDNTAQVWNVNTQELIGTYTKHCGPIYSCMWSPIDPDFIITGSADFTLRIWERNQKVVIPDKNLEAKKNKNKKNKIKNKEKTKNSSIEIDKVNGGNVQLLNGTDKSVNSDFDQSTIVEQEFKNSKESIIKEKKNRNKKGNLFSVYCKTYADSKIILKSCLKLARKVSNQSNNDLSDSDDDDDDVMPSMFGTKEDISKIINIEKIMHVSQGQHMMAMEMDIWNGDLREQLQEATKKSQLNDFLVSLAPNLSIKMWQTMCEAYATQLINEMNPAKAVCYLLCIHKISRAIEVLMESKMHRAAYVLAKCKLDPNDMMLNNILEKWASALSKNGQYEEAAQCYIKLGDIPKAARVLFKRKDTFALEVAAELAILSKDDELTRAILDQLITQSFLQYDVEKCRELIKKFPILQHRLIEVETMEKLMNIRESFDESYILLWLDEKPKCELLPTLNEHLQTLEIWKYDELPRARSSTIVENEMSLWMMINLEIAYATIAPTKEKQMHHIVSAFEIISQYEIIYPMKVDGSLMMNHLLISLISILDTKSFSVNSILKNNDFNVNKSLRAYTCLALLNWIVIRMKKQPNDETIPLQKIIDIIKVTIVDGLDRETVKYYQWTVEISKLENLLVSSISNKEQNDDNEKIKENSINLSERLATIRTDKEKFILERVSVPNPIMIYGKANEFCDLLENENVKSSFEKYIHDIWVSVTS